jgi:hypothetical protein
MGHGGGSATFKGQTLIRVFLFYYYYCYLGLWGCQTTPKGHKVVRPLTDWLIWVVEPTPRPNEGCRAIPKALGGGFDQPQTGHGGFLYFYYYFSKSFFLYYFF